MRQAVLGLRAVGWSGGEGGRGQGNSANAPLPTVFVSQHTHMRALPHVYLLNETISPCRQSESLLE